MAVTLFEAEKTVTYFRMLITLDYSVCALYQKRFDVAFGFGDQDRFFLPCTFVVGWSKPSP